MLISLRRRTSPSRVAAVSDERILQGAVTVWQRALCAALSSRTTREVSLELRSDVTDTVISRASARSIVGLPTAKVPSSAEARLARSAAHAETALASKELADEGKGRPSRRRSWTRDSSVTVAGGARGGGLGDGGGGPPGGGCGAPNSNTVQRATSCSLRPMLSICLMRLLPPSSPVEFAPIIRLASSHEPCMV